VASSRPSGSLVAFASSPVTRVAAKPGAGDANTAAAMNPATIDLPLTALSSRSSYEPSLRVYTSGAKPASEESLHRERRD
jgi:hypothetical protein